MVILFNRKILIEFFFIFFLFVQPKASKVETIVCSLFLDFCAGFEIRNSVKLENPEEKLENQMFCIGSQKFDVIFHVIFFLHSYFLDDKKSEKEIF